MSNTALRADIHKMRRWGLLPPMIEPIENETQGLWLTRLPPPYVERKIKNRPLTAAPLPPTYLEHSLQNRSYVERYYWRHLKFLWDPESEELFDEACKQLHNYEMAELPTLPPALVQTAALHGKIRISTGEHDKWSMASIIPWDCMLHQRKHLTCKNESCQKSCVMKDLLCGRVVKREWSDGITTKFELCPLTGIHIMERRLTLRIGRRRLLKELWKRVSAGCIADVAEWFWKYYGSGVGYRFPRFETNRLDPRVESLRPARVHELQEDSRCPICHMGFTHLNIAVIEEKAILKLMEREDTLLRNSQTVVERRKEAEQQYRPLIKELVAVRKSTKMDYPLPPKQHRAQQSKATQRPSTLPSLQGRSGNLNNHPLGADSNPSPSIKEIIGTHIQNLEQAVSQVQTIKDDMENLCQSRPVKLPCGHIYGSKCLDRLLKETQKDSYNRCLLCMKPIGRSHQNVNNRDARQDIEGRGGRILGVQYGFLLLHLLFITLGIGVLILWMWGFGVF